MTRLRLPQPRSSRLAAVLAFTLTVCILALLNQVTGAKQSSAPRPGLPIDALAATVWVEEFDVSPDGTVIAYKSAAAGTYDIWTVPRAAASRPSSRHARPEMAPRFTPDGRRIVFEADYGGTDGRDLCLVPVAEGRR